MAMMKPLEPAPLLRLPVELLTAIAASLPNRDIKTLRLVCRGLRSTVPLRLTRVFLSANPRNIAVLRAVADHESLRKQIVELVWDDARLRARRPRHTGEPMDEGGHEPGSATPTAEPDAAEPQPEPDHRHWYPWRCQRCEDESLRRGREQLRWHHAHLGWFEEHCTRNLEEVRDRRGQDVDRPDHLARDRLVADVMPAEESWAHYQLLLQQQREVLASKADVDAFRYALQHFPSLVRITLTPFAHGELFTPLYETPMIRAFPRGFNYPLPRTWHVNLLDESQHEQAPSWSGLSDADKDRWRGFRIVTRELARNPHHRVTELRIDDCHLLSGINCTIFSQPCAEYDDFAALLRRPGFCHLDLALVTHEQWHENWGAFRSGHLRRALAEAPAMEHISLSASEPEADPDWDPDGNHNRNFTPLRSIFPVEEWPRLRHFGLAYFMVRQDDLLSFLRSLPATLRTVELGCLLFIQGGYRGLLEEMRASLIWRERAAGERPRVTVGTVAELTRGRIIWADREVDDFLYGDGENPFCGVPGAEHMLAKGVGVERDPFDPNYERPNLDLPGLADAGYIKHAYFKGQKIY